MQDRHQSRALQSHNTVFDEIKRGTNFADGREFRVRPLVFQAIPQVGEICPRQVGRGISENADDLDKARRLNIIQWRVVDKWKRGGLGDMKFG